MRLGARQGVDNSVARGTFPQVIRSAGQDGPGLRTVTRHGRLSDRYRVYDARTAWSHPPHVAVRLPDTQSPPRRPAPASNAGVTAATRICAHAVANGSRTGGICRRIPAAIPVENVGIQRAITRAG